MDHQHARDSVILWGGSHGLEKCNVHSSCNSQKKSPPCIAHAGRVSGNTPMRGVHAAGRGAAVFAVLTRDLSENCS